MGSIRIVAAVAAIALVVPAAAAAAGAATPEEARPVAEQFVRALVTSDGAAACLLVSARMQQRLGADCASDLSDSSDDGSADVDARGSLIEAYVAALGSVTSRGTFPTPAKALKAELETAVDEVTFVIGSGPGVVRNRKHTVVGIDRVRSNATRVVLYAESDSGTIFRLNGKLRGSPAIAKAANGVPAPAPPLPEFQFASVAFGDAVTAFVLVTVSAEGASQDILLRLAFEGEAWRVDEIYLPISELLGELPL